MGWLNRVKVFTRSYTLKIVLNVCCLMEVWLKNPRIQSGLQKKMKGLVFLKWVSTQRVPSVFSLLVTLNLSSDSDEIIGRFRDNRFIWYENLVVCSLVNFYSYTFIKPAFTFLAFEADFKRGFIDRKDFIWAQSLKFFTQVILGHREYLWGQDVVYNF